MRKLTLSDLTKEVVKVNMAKFVTSKRWERLDESRSYLELAHEGEDYVISYYSPNKSYAIQNVKGSVFVSHFRRTGNVLIDSEAYVTDYKGNQHSTKSAIALWELMMFLDLELEIPEKPKSNFLDDVKGATTPRTPSDADRYIGSKIMVMVNAGNPGRVK